MKYVLIFFFLCWVQLGFCQDNQPNIIAPAQLGFSGLIYTPSAYQNPWKTIDIGFTHFSKATSFTYQAGIKAERAFIANVVFLPRVAFSLKLTRPYDNLRPDAQSGSGRPQYWGIGDRSYGLRVQVLKEKKRQPTLVIGVQDPSANLAFFNTNYLVLSKTVEMKTVQFSTNLGYGVSIEDTAGDYLQGVFGGFSATWKQTITGMIEYDTQHFNVGLGYQLKNLLFLNVALIDVQHFSGNISYRFSLN